MGVLDAGRSHPRLLVGDGAARTSTAWTCTGCSYENEEDDFLACEMCGTERPSAAGHGSIEEETIAQREALATAASLQLAKRLEEKEREEQEERDRVSVTLVFIFNSIFCPNAFTTARSLFSPLTRSLCFVLLAHCRPAITRIGS